MSSKKQNKSNPGHFANKAAFDLLDHLEKMPKKKLPKKQAKKMRKEFSEFIEAEIIRPIPTSTFSRRKDLYDKKTK